MIRREIALYHTIAYSLIKSPGSDDRRMHTLYILSPSSPPLPYIPLIEYFIEKGRTRNLSWQRDCARIVGLFLDFLFANNEILKSQKFPKTMALFAESLVGGTVNIEGLDPSGLFWQSKNINRASNMLNTLTMFSDWLENKYSAKNINPWRDSTISEQIAYWRRLDKRKATELLGYATSRSEHQKKASFSRSTVIPRNRIITMGHDIKIFPRDKIWDLLLKGFIVPGKQKSHFLYKRLNLKDILITILLHGGGLRESEPFHLYVTDVGINPENKNSAIVRLHHPEQGLAPSDYIDPLSGKRINANREEYLRTKWQMTPRNLVEGRFKAGWKDLMLFDEKEKFAYVHWFPSYWGEIFMSFFKLYINHCRSMHCNHPYLFVSQKEGFNGDPYTIDSFVQSHSRAIKRIGLEVNKALGTTPHGHRHAYGQNLADSEVDRMTIQRIMHHKSISSQEVYTDPPLTKIVDSMRQAEARMKSGGSLELESLDNKNLHNILTQLKLR